MNTEYLQSPTCIFNERSCRQQKTESFDYHACTVSDAAYIESGAYNRPRLIASDAWTGSRLVAAIILNVTAFSVYLGVY